MASVFNSVRGSAFNKIDAVDKYFSLKSENEKLIAENKELKNELNKFISVDVVSKGEVQDSLKHTVYKYISAKVINNSVNKQVNFIMLNAGSNDGIRPDMGVISSEGMVGMITKVSDKYSTAVSILNNGFNKFNGKLKSTSEVGIISWDGVNPDEVVLSDISQNSEIEVGDTVVTSRFSDVFPEDIPIGIVKSATLKNGIFYEARITLLQNFRSLHNVYVIDVQGKNERQNMMKEQEKQLQKK